MKRRLFNLLAAVSLVMCVAVSVLWFRSTFLKDDVIDSAHWNERDGRLTEWHAALIGGWAYIRMLTWVAKDDERGWARGYAKREVQVISRPRTRQPRGVIGQFRWPPVYAITYHDERAIGISAFTDSWNCGLALWPAVLLTMILPAWWCRGAMRRRRLTMAQLCRTCGYDLRATPDRCPECGTVPK